MVRHTLLDRFNLEPAKPSITLAAAARSNDVLVQETAFKNYQEKRCSELDLKETNIHMGRGPSMAHWTLWRCINAKIYFFFL